MRKKQEEERKRQEEERKRAAAQAEAERLRRIKEAEEERKRQEEERLRKIKEAEEERKRQEEERIARREERIKQEKLLAEKAEEQRLINVNKEIEDLIPKKEALDGEKEQFLTEVKNFETQLKPILEEENIIENKILEIEELEKITPLEKKKPIEKRRWETTTRRRELEKAKWTIQEKIEKVKEQIKGLELKYGEILRNEEGLKKERDKILQKKEEKRLTQEKSRLKNELAQLIEEEKTIENKKNELTVQKNKIEDGLEEILAEEQTTEEMIRNIERKEKESLSPAEQKKIEKSRWKIEDDRKALEDKRWKLEQEEKDFSIELRKTEKEKQEILRKEKPLKERLIEIDRLLKISPPEEEKLPTAELPKIEEKEEEREREREKETVEIQKPKFDQEKADQTEKTKEEKRKKIIEEEIKKRVAKEEERRQEESLWTEKKIFFGRSRLGPDETKFSPESPETEKKISETIIPKPPEKPSFAQKLFVRTLISAFVLSLVGLAYLFFVMREDKTPEEPILLPSLEEKTEEETPGKPEITIPDALISANTTETAEITDISEIPTLLGQILGKTFGAEEYARILFKNTDKNEIVGLREFFAAAAAEIPEEILGKLDDNFTLFVYSNEGVNRLGFIAKIKGEGLAGSMLSWESTMEKDTENLFEILGKEGSAAPVVFRETTYQNNVFRYASFPSNNFGICWAIIKDKLILTTSGGSMIKTIDKLTEEAVAAETMVNCGEIGPDNPDLNGEIQNCIEERFEKCQPAQYIVSMNLAEIGVITYYYEIIGPSNGLCAVKSKFLANPDPNWIDKEMICQYDNTKSFLVAANDMSSCQGPLYDLISAE